MAGELSLMGTTACVDAIISRYNEAASIIQRLKTNRADKQAPAPSRYLEETIQCAPADIAKEKERGLGRFGLAFQQGDDTALESLREVDNTLEKSLLHELQRLVEIEEFADLRQLMDAADSGRDQAINTLIRLRQRCLAAESSEDVSRRSSEADISPLQRTNTEPAKTYHFPHHNPWLRMHHRAHNPTRLDSRDVSGDEDAQSGAENHPKKHGLHRGSILHLLKHHRTHSYNTDASTAPDARPVSRQVAAGYSDGQAPSRTLSVVSLGKGPDSPPEPPNLQRYFTETPHRDSQASVETVVGISPTAQSYRSRAASTATSVLRTIPTPTQENDYLGFCKGAVRMQNGDKKAMEKRKEFNDGWSQATVYYLACSSHKCAFAGHMDVNIIMTKVFAFESKGLQFRWPFLARSHLMQQRMKDNNFSYQCLFCVYSGEKSPVYHGSDAYIDHVATHRGDIGAVTLYKTRCINDRVANASEEFDINLFPLSNEEARSRRASELQISDLAALNVSPYGYGSSKNDSVLESDEPWNEGLSDFHYRDEFERGEMG